MRILPIFLFALACGGTSDDSASTNPAYPPNLPLAADLIACSTPADCVVVELGCCDACNGGLAVAVNQGSLTEVTEDYSQDCTTPQTCTEMGCAPWELTCDEGACGLAPGSF